MITIQKPNFAYNALEPYFDARTMEIHVEKHHQTYADKLNALIDADPTLQNKTLKELMVPDDQTISRSNNQAVLNMAGGVANHDFFWSILSPDFDQPAPSWFTPELKNQFTDAATKFFGSGWVWLTTDLEIVTTPNQDSLLSQNRTPILGIDLWEHSYYLRYQNRRPEYIEAFWHVVNWKKVEEYINLQTNAS